MHVALIPIIKKQLVSSRLQHAGEKKSKHHWYTLEQILRLAEHLKSLPPVNPAREHPYKIAWWSCGPHSWSYVRPSCSTMSRLVSTAELESVRGCLVHALQGFFVNFCSHREIIISPNTPAVGKEAEEGWTWLPHRVVSMKCTHNTTSRPKILES